jgi:chorismate mutase
LKDSDVSVLEQEYGKEHVQEDLKVLGNREMVEKSEEETGLLMGTEVANAAHVKPLEYDIDVLWVGARTTVNPFAMQELADALTKKKIVLVKNPVNPDLSLWLGGVERLYNAGIEKWGNSQRFLYL